MKKLLLIPVLMFTLFAFTQSSTKQQDIQALLAALKINATMRSTVSNGVDLLKKKRPAVPQQVWDDIKNAIDYSSYMTKVAAVFDTNYSQQEIKNFIGLTATQKPASMQFKKVVQQQLYNAGNEFGKNFGNLIKLTLAQKGY